MLALGWVSAKVPNGDSIKKWEPYLHHGGHNRQNGDVNFDVADPVHRYNIACKCNTSRENSNDQQKNCHFVVQYMLITTIDTAYST